MKAAVLQGVGKPLKIVEKEIPSIHQDQLLIKVEACGLCRTDLHIIDAQLPILKPGVVLGHQIVGRVEKVGSSDLGFYVGDRVGISWLAKVCGNCSYCLKGQENLCDDSLFTGYSVDGGFAHFTVCFAKFAFKLQNSGSAQYLAPLLCAGLIGYRCYKKAKKADRIGVYGFGSAGHLVLQMGVIDNKKMYVFTRPGDDQAQKLAKSLGAYWVGSSDVLIQDRLGSCIIFASDGSLVPISLKNLDKGGVCVCGGIHMSDIPSFPYKDLWEERSITSIANLTVSDGKEFFSLYGEKNINPLVSLYSLEKVNQAIDDLRKGSVTGSIVIVMEP